MTRTPPAWIVLTLPVALALAGCDEPEGPRAYDAPKDEPIPQRAAAVDHDHDHHDHTHDTAPPDAAAVAWRLPDGWRISPEAKPMRFATLLTGEGDDALEVAVTVFPDDVGGPLANTNRWRQQVGLGPIDAAALPQQLVPLSDDDSPARLFDQAGSVAGQPARLLAAMVPGKGRTWFAKIIGPPDAVESQRDAFLAFARTLPPEAPPASAP